jgi:small neutral amino acid transporter SnatA (MarC family)
MRRYCGHDLHRFLSAESITRILGTKGMDIVTKFIGMILLAIASGMLAEGLKALPPGLAA